ncbi:LytR/AlgR family response regulator transcription factor [Spirosoma montaniterrae]|uniref:HTH LytTR-type domain-containing protein n=1 Tax=Spirosoma montaniterrae TaxID=1178516 RepID=A0A1P9WZK6_9BACT|nr:LytTR family DNA-binding domain-containing protein [Spirosoma montaniterrae]AQG80803.1 hypothetical protein AWR27_16645 [Spirosoma montaniterrae]
MVVSNSSPSLLLYLGRDRGRERRPLSALCYAQSELNYTWLVWADGDRLLVPRSLSYFMPCLPASDFVRLHRGYIVNRRFVAGVERGLADQRLMSLTTGEQLPISRRQWMLVRAWLSQPAN